MKKMLVVLLLLITCVSIFAGEISAGGGARFDIVSRTSFGIDLDNPYRFGLKNELTKFTFAFSLAPYQKLTNRVNSEDAVGFIDFTMFHLDLIKSPVQTPNQGGDAFAGPGNMGTNRFQTGEFIAGIVKGPWLLQLNAGGNEPFISPWNKGLQYVNDGIKLSWAYLDSMVDVMRVTPISAMLPIMPMGYELIDGNGSTLGADGIVNQFKQDSLGNGDDYAMGGSKYNQGHLVALMYNQETFGLNFKLATEKPFDDDTITEDNMNGLAFGVDSVFNPFPELRIFASVAGKAMYGSDASADDIMAGTKIGYTIALNEDVSLQPYVGLDIGTAIGDGGNPVEFELAGGLTMRWPGQAGWFVDYLRDSDGRVFPGMSIGYKMYGNSEANAEDFIHDIKFTLFEPKGDDGMFFGIGSEIIVDFVDVGSDARSLMATAYVDYTMYGALGLPGALVPWAIICYDNLPDGSDRLNDMKLDLGVKLENAIANTTFGFSWHSGSLIQQTEYHWGYLRATAEIRF